MDREIITLSCLEIFESVIARTQKLAQDVKDKKAFITELKTKALEVSPNLSLHDHKLIDERIRDTEHRFDNTETIIQQRLMRCSQLDAELKDIKEEAHHYLTWLKQCADSTGDADAAWNSPEEVHLKLEEFTNLRLKLSQSLSTLNEVCRKAQALFIDIPSQERDSVKILLATLHTGHNELSILVDEKCLALHEIADEWRELTEKIEQLNIWLKEKIVTDTSDTVRLLTSKNDRHLDKCKSMTAKVQNQTARVNEIKTKAESLKQHFSNQGRKKIDQVISEMSSQHEDLLQSLKQKENNLRDISISLKKFQFDCQKIDRWCKEIEMDCEEVLPSDCALEILEEKLQVYKKRSEDVQDFQSFVEETKQLGESFFPSLIEEDTPVLQQKLEMLHDTFSRVYKQVQNQMHCMEAIIKTHSGIQEQTTHCHQQLKCLQDEITHSNVSVGPEVKDAVFVLQVFKGIAEKLNNQELTIRELSYHIEKLRTDGQYTQADDIVRLTDLYEVLNGQVQRHMESCKAALTLRETFMQCMLQCETAIKECENMVTEKTTTDLSMLDHIDRYKVAIEKLQQQETELRVVTLKRANQVGIQVTEDYLTEVTGEVDNLSKRVQDLQSHIQDRLTQCEDIQRESESFDALITDALTWFEKKENYLTSCRPLPLDAEKLTAVREKYKVISTEATEKLLNIKETEDMLQRKFETISHSLPQDVSEKILQIQILEESVMTDIAIKEKYLSDAQLQRKRFENSFKQVTEGLRRAEGLMHYGYDGLDYDTLSSTLSEINDHFTEVSLWQDEITQICELSKQILPTLDTNDSTTMKQIGKNIKRKYSNFVSTLQNKQAKLEEKVSQWKYFQDEMVDLHGKMDISDTEWMTVDKISDISLDAVNTHLELVRSFLKNTSTSRSTIDNLNEIARDLDRMGTSNSRTLISRLIGSVNHRWERLNDQAEAKVLFLEEIREKWIDYMSVLSTVDLLMQDSRTNMSTVTPSALTYVELCSQLGSLEEITQHLKQIESQVVHLQSSHLSLQKALPTVEGNVFAQENYMELIERYDRLVEKVQEKTHSFQEEINSREKLYSQVDKTIICMRETIAAVHKCGLGLAGLSDGKSEYKLYEQEISIQMEQVKILENSLRAKYLSLGTELPAEIQQKLSELHALECEVQIAVKEKDQELLNIQEVREKYNALLQTVTLWLQRTDMQLQETILSIPESISSHQNLLMKFENFKTDLNNLRTNGENIIKHSSYPEEKHTVQKTLADINRQWLSIQAQTAARSRELSEAADLYMPSMM